MHSPKLIKLIVPILIAGLYMSACNPITPAPQLPSMESSSQVLIPFVQETASPSLIAPPDNFKNQATAQPESKQDDLAIDETPESTPDADQPSPDGEDRAFENDPDIEIPLIYRVQSGDTLAVIAKRFGVRTSQITSPDPLPTTGLLIPGQVLRMPPSISTSLPPSVHLLPDSEVVYGPSAIDFNAQAYLIQAGSALSQYQEYLRSTGWTSAGDIVERVALENSINPRLLLTLLEYTCVCVRNQVGDQLESGYALGVEDFRRKGLYGQLGWAASQLSVGYYGWRDGTLLEFTLPDGTIFRPAPNLNAGSIALIYYTTKLWEAQSPTSEGDLKEKDDWAVALDIESGLPALHSALFENPWSRAAHVEPLLPAGLSQPEMNLPFEPDRLWAFASGPHPAWQREGAMAALDFAPATDVTGCVESKAWVVAVADGPVVRSEHGAVVQDLDHDGERTILSDMHEQTGWAVLYMHIASHGRAAVGTYLHAGDPLGHPSCEGGPATGTHLHIARKYNGEWILAGGPLAFIMDGWVAQAGDQPYQGSLVRGDQVVIADPWSTRISHLIRTLDGD